MADVLRGGACREELLSLQVGFLRAGGVHVLAADEVVSLALGHQVGYSVRARQLVLLAWAERERLADCHRTVGSSCKDACVGRLAGCGVFGAEDDEGVVSFGGPSECSVVGSKREVRVDDDV